VGQKGLRHPYATDGMKIGLMGFFENEKVFAPYTDPMA
jgi:hypothetical protein